MLLAFILLGMVFGSEGLVRIDFADFGFAETICSIALIFIMFYGGFGTRWKTAKPAALKALVMSAFGTIFTALFTGLFCHYVLHFDLLEGLLTGAVLGSTDAASVFSVLRSKNLSLKDSTDSLLEVESGSNDPAAYMLTIILLTAMKQGVSSRLPLQILTTAATQILFGLAILAALAMGCTPKKYWALISSKKRSPSITGGFGNDVFLMNFGVFGLFILGYYNLVGASFNGATFGVMFCMLSTCNSGSHPLNAWPMLLGYMVASPLMHWLSRLVGGHFTYVINTQSILIGACYSNGMTPIVDKYGPGLGFLSGILHFLLVTSVPLLHGGYCLYNGGLTAAFICLILMPTAEELLPTREQRRLRKAEKAAKK